ncbi:MAG: amidase [Gammaproteobacteria bacterium]
MTSDLHLLSIAEAGAALRRGTLRSMDLTTAALARIEALEPRLNAFQLVTRERALADAARSDRELSAGRDLGPLHGIPYGLKDIYSTAGIPTTCNSRLLLKHVPAADAFVQSKLRAGGAVLLGKLTTHEFAIGGPGLDLPCPPARNPWSPCHFTGGSSSGCGTALGAGYMRVAFGSDTGGSIRSPAAHCGVVGVKPTYGRVSRRGVFPLSYSLDHCGPMSWSVSDAALAMSVIAGHDPLDPGSADVPVPDFSRDLNQGVASLRLAYARALFTSIAGVSGEVVALMDRAAQSLAKLGADVEEVELPDFELFKSCARIIMTAEAYAIHEQDLKQRPLEFGRYTYQRIVPAAALSAADLIQAQRLRRELTVALQSKVFARYDAILTTVALSPAPRLDEFPLDWPPPSLAVAVQTALFNVTGHPAMSMPAGFSASGLPLGMQIATRAFEEPLMFRIAAALESAMGVTGVRPPCADVLAMAS